MRVDKDRGGAICPLRDRAPGRAAMRPMRWWPASSPKCSQMVAGAVRRPAPTSRAGGTTATAIRTAITSVRDPRSHRHTQHAFRLVYHNTGLPQPRGDLFRTRMTHAGWHQMARARTAPPPQPARRPAGDLAGARPQPRRFGQDAPGRDLPCHAAPDAGGFEHNQSLRVVDVLEGATPIIGPEPVLRDARGHPQALFASAYRALEPDDPGGVGAPLEQDAAESGGAAGEPGGFDRLQKR